MNAKDKTPCPVSVTLGPEKPTKPVRVIVSGSFGDLVPQEFVKNINPRDWSGLPLGKLDVLLDGPNNPGYWEVWEELISNAVFTPRQYPQLKGKLLDGKDLLLVFDDLLNDSEYLALYGEWREDYEDRLDKAILHFLSNEFAEALAGGIDDKVRLLSTLYGSSLHTHNLKVDWVPRSFDGI